MNYINIIEFGRDHWSVFGYVLATAISGITKQGKVDGKKVGLVTLNPRALRCNHETNYIYKYHECYTFDGITSPLNSSFDETLSTRLKGYTKLTPNIKLGHDDYDCLHDLENEGLLIEVNVTNYIWSITDRGWDIASTLHKHKGSGKNFADFEVNI